jgi:hypothetical protein
MCGLVFHGLPADLPQVRNVATMLATATQQSHQDGVQEIEIEGRTHQLPLRGSLPDCARNVALLDRDCETSQ